MTDDMLGPSPMRIKNRYVSCVYDGPICLVLMSPSYPMSPVVCSLLRKLPSALHTIHRILVLLWEVCLTSSKIFRGILSVLCPKSYLKSG